MEDAKKGLEKKTRIFEKEEAERIERERIAKLNANEQRKYNRRLRLIAHLCKNVKATFADARSMGYCIPGIENFKQKYNIGNHATLAELMNTKNDLAIKLALNIARKVKKERV